MRVSFWWAVKMVSQKAVFRYPEAQAEGSFVKPQSFTLKNSTPMLSSCALGVENTSMHKSVNPSIFTR